MHCKYCGHALSKNSAVCPNCKRLLTEDQLKTRKELNGVNNPYMDKLNDLYYQKEKYKLEENGEDRNIGSAILILLVIIFTVIIAVIIYLNNR